jgi:hypothetical protein
MRTDVVDFIEVIGNRSAVLLEPGQRPVYGRLASLNGDEVKIKGQGEEWTRTAGPRTIFLVELYLEELSEDDELLRGDLPTDALIVAESQSGDWTIGRDNLEKARTIFVLVNGEVDINNPPRPFRDALRGREQVAVCVGKTPDGFSQKYQSEAPFGLSLVLGDSRRYSPFGQSWILADAEAAADFQVGDEVAVELDGSFIRSAVNSVAGDSVTFADPKGMAFDIRFRQEDTPIVRRVLFHQGFDPT